MLSLSELSESTCELSCNNGAYPLFFLECKASFSVLLRHNGWTPAHHSGFMDENAQSQWVYFILSLWPHSDGAVRCVCIVLVCWEAQADCRYREFPTFHESTVNRNLFPEPSGSLGLGYVLGLSVFQSAAMCMNDIGPVWPEFFGIRWDCRRGLGLDFSHGEVCVRLHPCESFLVILTQSLFYIRFAPRVEVFLSINPQVSGGLFFWDIGDCVETSVIWHKEPAFLAFVRSMEPKK